MEIRDAEYAESIAAISHVSLSTILYMLRSRSTLRQVEFPTPFAGRFSRAFSPSKLYRIHDRTRAGEQRKEIDRQAGRRARSLLVDIPEQVENPTVDLLLVRFSE